VEALASKKFTDINEGFTCIHCGREVQPSRKSCRNHCPFCLHSLHLDIFPGDRAANCGGLMVPVRVVYNSKKGYQIVHRCEKCGTESRNVAHLEDENQPDSLEALLEIMRKCW
jgi:DNA-directed RNA polymerase subunit RPC12/RpoP